MNPASGKTVPNIGIIGGGVAGMSCALWLKQLGLSPHIIERNAALGGQLLNIDRINRWVLGSPNQTSSELAARCRNHIAEANITLHYCTQVTAITPRAGGFQLSLQDRQQQQTILPVHALVIASGVRILGADVFATTEGFNALTATDLISSFPTDHLEQLDALRGKTVAVIGGGDNAYFTVKDIAAVAARTYLLMRSPPKAHANVRAEVDRLIAQGRVIAYQNTTIDAFQPAQNGVVMALNSANAPPNGITVDRIFTRLGFMPNSDFLTTLSPLLAQLQQQQGGYLCTDSWRRSSLAGVYAIGDIASPDLQSVVTAIADGAIAAKAIMHDLDKRI